MICELLMTLTSFSPCTSSSNILYIEGIISNILYVPSSFYSELQKFHKIIFIINCYLHFPHLLGFWKAYSQLLLAKVQLISTNFEHLIHAFVRTIWQPLQDSLHLHYRESTFQLWNQD